MLLMQRLVSRSLLKKTSSIQRLLGSIETSLCLKIKDWGTRGFADGPPRQSLKAIPFTVTREEAVERFHKYHSANFLLNFQRPGADKVKEVFLPFWVTSARAATQLYGAEVGVDRWVQVYNPATRRYESQMQTFWQSVRMSESWVSSYPASEPSLQVYGSWKYLRAEVHALKPGDLVERARPLTPDLLTSPTDGSTRRIAPFHMTPATAVRLASEWIGQKERQLAEERHLPCMCRFFVFTNHHFGLKLHTFVSGVEVAKVGGQRLYDEGKVGLLVGLASGAALFLSGAFPKVMSAWDFWVWGVALPVTLAGVMVHYLPRWRKGILAWFQNVEQMRHTQADLGGGWDTEWRAFSRQEEQQRRWDEEDARRWRGGSAWGWPGGGWGTQWPGAGGIGGGGAGWPGGGSRPGGGAWQSPGGGGSQARPWDRDPSGYYKTLGVEPSASKEDIQAAYRGQAMKWHPDHVKEGEKETANRKFQQLNEAYSVLRDPAKRRMYDQGGSP
eukprot:jgi/Botrbrau1/8237/Bobra.0392s0032.1